MIRIKTILVAVAHDNTESRVLEAVCTLAAQLGAEIVLVHVLEVEPEHETRVEKAAFHAAMSSWLEGLRDDLAQEGVRVRQVQCRKGEAFLEIVACSEDLEADLIVLGTRGAESPHLFQLGTTVEKVIRKSAKPVMIVHPEKPFRLGKVLCPVDCSSASARALTYAIQLTRAFRSRLQVMRVVPLPFAAQRLVLRGCNGPPRPRERLLPSVPKSSTTSLADSTCANSNGKSGLRVATPRRRSSRRPWVGEQVSS